MQTAPARIRQFRQGDNPWFEVGLIEGRNRELRKMFEEIGHHVEKIRRVGYGPLELDVEPGKMRELTAEEVQALRLAAAGKLKPKRSRTAAMPGEGGRSVRRDAAATRGERPAQRGEQRRAPDRTGQNWQDRRKQDEGRSGEYRPREQRSFPDRGRPKVSQIAGSAAGGKVGADLRRVPRVGRSSAGVPAEPARVEARGADSIGIAASAAGLSGRRDSGLWREVGNG